MTRPHISDLQLELLALGALPDHEAEALRALLSEDPDAQARFEGIAPSNQALLREFPPDDVAAEIERRIRLHDLAAPNPWGWLAVWLHNPGTWALVAVAACLLTVWLVPALMNSSDPTSGQPSVGERIKGAPALVVHRVLEGGVTQRLTTADAARPGDTVQLSVSGAQNRYAVIVSIDGRGQVTRHFPLKGNSGAIISTAKAIPFTLPHAYELDDAPDFERFILLTHTAPFDVAQVMSSAQKVASGSHKHRTLLVGLPKKMQQTSFLLKKKS
ncbi:MAG: ActD-like protein [Myxococcota bacterium]